MRSRLCAMEFRVGHRPDLYSATPPLEAVRMVLAELAGNPEWERGSDDPRCLMHIDISRAYFHAACTKPTYVEIPEEDKGVGDEEKVGKLYVSMYGTREAQMNWEKTYSDLLTGIGFKRGRASPCTF